MKDLREIEGVFYNLVDIDINGRPYEDAQPVSMLKETEEELRIRLERERKLKIQKAQMADDEHRDAPKCQKTCSTCECSNNYKILFATNTHEGVKYDTYGFEIQEDVCHHHNKIYGKK